MPIRRAEHSRVDSSGADRHIGHISHDRLLYLISNYIERIVPFGRSWSMVRAFGVDRVNSV